MDIFPESEVLVVAAITPKEIDSEALDLQKRQSSHLIGRQVGEREISVMLSHRKCYESFLRSNKEILFVLEDDIVIEDDALSEKIVFEKVNREVPTIISLYSPFWSVWVKRKRTLKAKFPPAFAAAYLINKSAVRWALSFEPVGIADWPPWALDVNFYLQEFAGLFCGERSSYLAESRFLDKEKKMKKVLFKKPMFEIKKSWQIKYIIIYPLLWKIYVNCRFFSKSKFLNSRVITWL